MKRRRLDDAVWHVTLRGARRLLLYRDAQDFATFYSLLGAACERSGVRLLGECLMSNHFHLIPRGGTDQLTDCMTQLDYQYATYHNDRYGLSGHAFDRSYYAEPIPSDFILKRVLRYVHLNPVRAGMVAHPREYAWSSYRRFMNTPPASLGDEERRVLGTFGGDPRTARTAYETFLRRDLERKLTPIASKSPAGELWQAQYRDLLEFATEQWAQVRPLDPADVAAYWAVRVGVPPRFVARVAGLPDGRSVSRAVYKVSRRLEEDPGLAARIASLRVL